MRSRCCAAPALQGSPSLPLTPPPQPPPPSEAVPDENLLIIELIREWLVFNQLSSTVSVFMAETGAPALPLDRPELATLVGIVDDAQSAQLCVRCARLHRGGV